MPHEDGATQPPTPARSARWARRAFVAAVASLALTFGSMVLLFGVGSGMGSVGIAPPEWLALALWACVPIGGLVAIIALGLAIAALIRREGWPAWGAAALAVAAFLPQFTLGLLAVGILGSSLKY